MSELTKRPDESQTEFTIRCIRAEAWQEGFDAGENMAHMWGHVDHWEDWPTNPHTAPADHLATTEGAGEVGL